MRKTVITWQQKITYRGSAWVPEPDCVDYSHAGYDGCAVGHHGDWAFHYGTRLGSISTVTLWNGFQMLTDETPWCTTPSEFRAIKSGMTQRRVKRIFWGNLPIRVESFNGHKRIVRQYDACHDDPDYTDFYVAYIWNDGAYRVWSKWARYKVG